MMFLREKFFVFKICNNINTVKENNIRKGSILTKKINCSNIPAIVANRTIKTNKYPKLINFLSKSIMIRLALYKHPELFPKDYHGIFLPVSTLYLS